VGKTVLVQFEKQIAETVENPLQRELRFWKLMSRHPEPNHEYEWERNLWIDRILNNILRCSSLQMSDWGLLLELGSFHRRGQCELIIISPLGQACVRNSVMTPLTLDSLSPDHLSCYIDEATKSPWLWCSCMSGFKMLHPLSGHPHDHNIKCKYSQLITLCSTSCILFIQ